MFYLDIDDDGDWSAGDWASEAFGAAGDQPVVGDWVGDGKPRIGVYQGDSGRFLLDLNGNGRWDGESVDRRLDFGGSSAFRPVAGDWNGDGVDDIGLYLPSKGTWYLDRNGDGTWQSKGDLTVRFGCSQCLPVVGDWVGDGRTYLGVYHVGLHAFYLDSNRNGRWNPSADQRIAFRVDGAAEPVVGDWNDDGVDEMGLFDPSSGNFYLDADGDGVWNPSNDRTAAFGQSGDRPVSGRWAPPVAP